MLISVVLPTYNVKEYIEQCVQSLVQQTYTNVEILIVDDGATDGTSELCDQLAKQDPRIRVFHKENGGTHTARNRGIQEANGEYIMFLDPDDWLETDTFAQLVPMIEKYTPDVIRFGYVREFGDRSVVKPNTFLPETLCVGKDCKTICRQTLGLVGQELAHPENMNFLASACFCLYRKAVIDKNGLQLPNIHEIATFSDGLFNIRFLQNANSFLYVDKPFYHYRKFTAGAATSKHRPEFFERQLRLFAMLRQIAQHEEDPQFMQAYNNRVAFSTMEICLNALKGEYTLKQQYAQIRQVFNSDEHKKAYKQLKIKYLPMVWKVYYSFVKMRLPIVVLFLTKIIRVLQRRG